MSDLLKTQKGFARKAQARKDHRFEDLYHLICRRGWIRQALEHVLANAGSRTPGVDGLSRKDLETEDQKEAFIQELQADLKSRAYQPMPVQRVWIPRPGKSEKRGLGIPTIRDRVVQELLRMLMEPIWESDFLNCSYGFRPERRTMDAIARLYAHIHPHHKYFWVIEGDIRKCFDRINHRILMRLVRRRIADQRILNLVEAFLKAGVLDDGLFQDTPEGTPQGGILSPLLANIYLHELDLWWHRKFVEAMPTDYKREKIRKQGGGRAILIRYADDFVTLWNGTRQDALALKEELKAFLWEELHLELSDDKTIVTHAMDGFDFLGFHIQWRPRKGGKASLIVTPAEKNIARFRAKIKEYTSRSALDCEPDLRIRQLNRIIRGWGNYYRHVSHTRAFSKLDWWISLRMRLWLVKKHEGKGTRWVLRRYLVRDTRNGRNRDSWMDKDSRGRPVYLAKLSDIPVEKYPTNRRIPHPYLEAETIPTIVESDAPNLDAGPKNIGRQRTTYLELRKAVRERDNYRCVYCGKPATVAVLDTHHIQARQERGQDALDNLITLCKECHKATPTYGRNMRAKTG